MNVCWLGVYASSVRNTQTHGQNFTLGAIATMIASTLTFPAARARAILQTQRLPSGREQSAKTPTTLHAMHVIRTILANEGWLGLYKGLGPQLVKGVLSSALMLATKEKLQKYAAIYVRLCIMALQLLLQNSQQHVLRLRASKTKMP